MLAALVAVCGFIGAILGNVVVEWYRNQNRLRLAAIDKRLQAHQEAYAWSVKLWFAVNTASKTGDKKKITEVKMRSLIGG